jgi:succinate dehydrogenase flavin-adding protein (antitoxin of CptAB toxin-antitoxin module)
MAMVDRYKKSGGFLQLVQVIETCNQKKREQFMNIITEESPNWAEALNQKCITFDKIISWKPEVILDIIASVNTLAFSAALKSLNAEQLEIFLQKLSHQDRKKIELAMQESNPNPNEIFSSVLKVISETRGLMVQGTLKAERIDANLVIPEEFESMLEKNEQSRQASTPLNFDGPSFGGAAAANSSAEVDKLQKKLVLMSKEIQVLKQENQVMKDKLDKIKKIA